ncbi:chemotaxis protein CheA [Rhodomicrobium udaipurense JA643]|uniref:Chemotaxis protein CheA n=1 Tax=Rhodomicrobium udaipurense TaxID=1202716 RepID=A0A8I1GCW7_9HYPH|nr:chemotaxis protein CheA [Rhodomicrobium udaipurense]KAI95387.1 chemotaxis protein CheA [Rhodomicrobium udaipurense JA643]MBJ7542153.1 chemotaxis protein CheA [Rhodomicrobium udaipurense]
MKASDPADTFRQEARELLDTLEETLLDLGQRPDDKALVDGSFRALHTLKGSGAMFGFDEMAEFVHEFETAFDRVRKDNAPISPALVAIALAAKDHIHKLIVEPALHADGTVRLLGELRETANNAECGETGNADAVAVAVSERPRGGCRVRFWLPSDAIAFGTNPLLLLDELRELGASSVLALTDRLPPLEAMNPQASYLGWEVAFENEVSADKIEDVFLFIRDGMDLLIEPTDQGDAFSTTEPAEDQDSETPLPAKPDAQEPARRATDTAPQADKANSSVRVAAERLDELMDRVGELVIVQSRLSQIAGASADLNLKAVVEELGRLSSGLRDTTMGIRMVPIGTVFSRFRRLVHDLSNALGKEVDFVTTGGETELDKTMIERLADPLVHIIRNSIDHGLESPEKRASNGKPARGQVRLAAIHTGAEVAITITDDGAGLDAARIRAKAEEAGLLSPDQKISAHDLCQLIFHPGFSTAAEVTSVSGRGVGMDVVKRAVEGLRGTIDLTTTPGQGTVVTLRLPLTLAIIESMLVRVGGGRYAIPLSAVEECVELPSAAELGGSGKNFLNIRDRIVPFLRLRELFKVDAPPELHQKVVIVSAGESRVGFVVDQIIGNSQTVIKSMSKLHFDVETFSGATILGDGTVALILDIGSLVAFGQGFERQWRGEGLGKGEGFGRGEGLGRVA